MNIEMYSNRQKWIFFSAWLTGDARDCLVRKLDEEVMTADQIYNLTRAWHYNPEVERMIRKRWQKKFLQTEIRSNPHASQR